MALIAMLGVIPVDAVTAAPTRPTPDVVHPWVMQQAATKIATAKTGPLQPFKAAPKLPAVGSGTTGPQREVFGFALASSLIDPNVGYTTWNFSLLTTVAFFGLHVQDNGTFAPDAGAAVWNSSQLSGLLATAHAHGVKVVLTIILQDFSAGTPHMCSGLAHTIAAVNSTVAEVAAKGVDGVNIDYEGLNGSCGTTDSSWARHAFTNFASYLRSKLPPGALISVDSYASSAADPLGFFDIRGVAPSIDAFFVMAYDLEYSNYAHAPASCRSFCLGPTAPLAGYYYNDTTTAAQYLAAVPASKVILGVPYYGRKSCVAAPTPNQYPITPVEADAYIDAAAEYSSPLVKLYTYAAHRDPRDPAGQERWDYWVNTSLNCIRELYWDDVVSLGDKYALINRDNLRGVGIWTLNYGAGSSELWSALNNYFSYSCPANLAVQAIACTTKQYAQSRSNGSTWVSMDATNLSMSFTPAVDSWAVMSGNADLWTANAGYNQDLGIAVAGGGYPSVAGQPEVWKESGGGAGTFSPNAAFVQRAIPVTHGVAYTASLVWKANKPDAGTIVAGAGPVLGTYSPTRLTVQLVPTRDAAVFTASVSNQRVLTGSNGATWQDMDAANLSVAFTPPAGAWTVFMSANADLWTSTRGFNQDLGIALSGTGFPSVAGQPEAWKESGGFAGAFSPNAAYVQAPVTLSGGTSYMAKLVWKASRPDPGSIYAGAGPISGQASRTTLTVLLMQAGAPSSLVAGSTKQYRFANSDGNTWSPVDLTSLNITLAPSVDTSYTLSVNANLWTAVGGYNQDVGIMVRGGNFGSSGTLVAWKESGGFGGTLSPNAAFVTTNLTLSGGTTYVVWAVWKANHSARVSNAIYIGAGPIGARFSPTWLTVRQVS
jgi:spore germination protein YaaH